MDNEESLAEYLKNYRVSRNHIVSPVDQYNALVDFIELSYRETYPDDKNWGRLTVIEMIDYMRSSATYEKKYQELLNENLRHNQEMSVNLLKSIFEVTGIIEEAEEDNTNLEGAKQIKDLLETFKSKVDNIPPKTKKRKSVKNVSNVEDNF